MRELALTIPPYVPDEERRTCVQAIPLKRILLSLAEFDLVAVASFTPQLGPTGAPPMRAPAYSRQLVLAMAGSFAVALLIAATVLAILGTGERALFIALRATARWSFLLFWLAYVAGPSRAVFGARLTPLAVLGRPLGLSFASAHLVHVSLVVWLYRVSTEPPVPQSSLIFFGIGVFWTYLLVLLSLPLFWRFLGSRASRVLLHLGVNYILLAFLIDFMKPTPRHDALTELLYLPFVTLCLFAAGLRIFWVGRAAWPLSRHLWSRLQRASRRM